MPGWSGCLVEVIYSTQPYSACCAPSVAHCSFRLAKATCITLHVRSLGARRVSGGMLTESAPIHNSTEGEMSIPGWTGANCAAAGSVQGSGLNERMNDDRPSWYPFGRFKGQSVGHVRSVAGRGESSHPSYSVVAHWHYCTGRGTERVAGVPWSAWGSLSS